MRDLVFLWEDRGLGRNSVPGIEQELKLRGDCVAVELEGKKREQQRSCQLLWRRSWGVGEEKKR
jgi:hypothetical protein